MSEHNMFIWNVRGLNSRARRDVVCEFLARERASVVCLVETKAPPKVKLFFWLALHRRLWTAARRKRHHLQDDDACVLCDQVPETCGHLFLGCTYAKELWFKLLDPVGLTTLVPEQDDNLGEWWLRQRRRLDRTARSSFDTLILLVAWSLWKERNERTFQRTSRTHQEIFNSVVAEAEDWVAAGFKTLELACPLWSLRTVPM
jgi:hypothetical protein